MESIALMPLPLPAAAPLPVTPYTQIFNNVTDRASESPIGDPMPKAWGDVRLAAWAWSGSDDIGPVVLDTGWPASYAAAAALGTITLRDILSI